ncbi:hypothetical protein V8G54_004427, partial [Vigna mungo]
FYLPYLCLVGIYICIILHYKYITLCILSTKEINPILSFTIFNNPIYLSDIESKTCGLMKRMILAYQTMFHGWIYMNLLLLKRELQVRIGRGIFVCAIIINVIILIKLFVSLKGLRNLITKVEKRENLP